MFRPALSRQSGAFYEQGMLYKSAEKGHNSRDRRKEMTQLTTKDLEVISHLMIGEQMACKKARIYANTLTDVDLAAQMQALAEGHERRFNNLLTVLSGGGV